MVANREYEHILSKIKDKQQIPLWYKNVYNGGLVVAITGLYLGSVTFMVWLSYDVYEKTRICQYESCSIDTFTYGLAFEYGLLALIFGISVYLIYRSTDWPYVKERLMLIVSFAIVGVILTSGAVAWIKSSGDPFTEGFYDLKEEIKISIPWRRGAIPPNNNLQPLVGVVKKSDTTTLVLHMPMKQKAILFYESSFPETSKPKVGSRVIVQIKLVNNALYVKAIDPL